MRGKVKGQRPLGKWIELVKETGGVFVSRLDEIYAGNDQIKAEGVRMALRTLEAFAQEYGSVCDVLLVRSTGRLNLLGMHTDHRGGSVNAISINQMWLVAEPRDDDVVLIKNVESDQFADEQFVISECLPKGEKIDNWDQWCHGEYEKRKGDPSITWSNYVRAAILYFQHLNTNDDGTFEPVLGGMNMMFYGNIPTAVGLSSSSSLVTMTAETVLRINAVEMDPIKMVEHCGPAEWYVGTRGGYCDQAAIRLGRPNQIQHMTSFPLGVQSLPLPAGYKIVLANSLIEAKKQAGARDVFNSRVAGYVFGLMMIRKNFSEYADKLEHLRDVNTQNLGIDEVGIYEIIKSLPESAGRNEILNLLDGQEEEVRHVFRSHNEPQEGYKIRQVCLYGISEFVRADMAIECLENDDTETFGELITISHNGDRVTRLVDGERVPIDNSYPNAKIDALISDLQSAERQRIERARLWRQHGGYNVSIPEIDTLVDIAMASPGVVGAGLIGAGMGGSIVAIVEEKRARQLIDNMSKQYYQPRNLPTETRIVTPIGGLCIM